MAKAKDTTTVVLDDTKIAEIYESINKVGDGRVGQSICHMIQSRFSILYVQSAEERRIISLFENISLIRNAECFRWDCDRGLLNMVTLEAALPNSSEIHSMPTAVLAHIIDEARKDAPRISEGHATPGKIFLLLDFHTFLDSPNVQRKLKEFSEIASACVIIIVAPVFNCPPTLDKYVTLVDFPVPSKNELRDVLHLLIENPIVQTKLPNLKAQAAKEEEELIQSVSGLSLAEAENAFAVSIIRAQKFDIKIILDEKEQIIKKSGILEYITPRFTMENVGGLGALKDWFDTRKLAFKNEAREFGLPVPKGALILGMPGSGKSLICEAVATRYEMPLLRLDFGAIFSSLVGDSEKNIRAALRVAEAVSPTILMLDEVEKGVSGVASSSQTDGGVTSRVFGTLLTWMQVKTHPVFIVATANNVLGIPPEFMRAGRFDEIFFVDLPELEERADIISVLLTKKKRNPDNFNLLEIAKHCDHYSAAEIEKGIDNALFVAFFENKRQMTTKDIIQQFKLFYPLYHTRHEEIDALRKWALGEDGHGGRARSANSPRAGAKNAGDLKNKAQHVRVLDMMDV